ncbi:MAG: sulfate ABC transporter substrate-binding protein [Eubacteriales bacterium]|nr:sulfate ABC transporter substrate-binding protein [Eubacteriales bacterium]
MYYKRKITAILLASALSVGILSGCGRNGSDSGSATAAAGGDSVEITNVSYDPTRELYAAYNDLFAEHWKEQTGQSVTVTQSHGGSGKQALEVANGLEADVVTLALEGDVDAVRDAGLIEDGYTEEFANDSAPYTSSIVFLVRKDNPKDIQDWDDLLRDDVGVITPNPKTSGGARWNYLAAWYYFEKQGQSEEEITESMKQLYQNVLVLDSGARGATTSFVENKQGDVLLAWENEAFLSLEEYPGEYEIVIPSVSILCQPTVAVVDEVVDARGTRDVATEYLDYLYSDEAQRLEAENFYRPSNEDILAEYTSDSDSNTITEIPEDGKWIITNNFELTDIDHFGGWTEATQKHFSDGGIFDSIYEQQ